MVEDLDKELDQPLEDELDDIGVNIIGKSKMKLRKIGGKNMLFIGHDSYGKHYRFSVESVKKLSPGNYSIINDKYIYKGKSYTIYQDIDNLKLYCETNDEIIYKIYIN